MTDTLPEVKVIQGECMETMKGMPECSFDSIVTDSPYALGFMGAEWDSYGGSTGNETIDERREKAYVYANENKGAPRYGNSHGKRVKRDEMVAYQESMTPIFEEALRVAKPGSYMLCFGGTRTFHRLACAIEDAGWEIRNCVMWIYSQGFPKGMNVSKAIDKALGAEREVIGKSSDGTSSGSVALNHGKVESAGYAGDGRTFDITVPSTDEAKRWDGYNTALKPAWEPIIMAQKPLDGTVVNNILTHGVGALNIDGCRIPVEPHKSSRDGEYNQGNSYRDKGVTDWQGKPGPRGGDERGRYPANLCHDGSDEVVSLFPESKGQLADVADGTPRGEANCYGTYGPRGQFDRRNDSGSAARFFYCAKASKSDRGEGNNHPTIKPTALMQWLVRLVTPEGGGGARSVLRLRLHGSRMRARGHGIHRHRDGLPLRRHSQKEDRRRACQGQAAVSVLGATNDIHDEQGRA